MAASSTNSHGVDDTTGEVDVGELDPVLVNQVELAANLGVEEWGSLSPTGPLAMTQPSEYLSKVDVLLSRLGHHFYTSRLATLKDRLAVQHTHNNNDDNNNNLNNSNNNDNELDKEITKFEALAEQTAPSAQLFSVGDCTTDPSLMSLLCRLVGNLLHHPSFLHQVREPAFDPITQMMKQHPMHLSLQRWSLWALSVMCTSHFQNEATVTDVMDAVMCALRDFPSEDFLQRMGGRVMLLIMKKPRQSLYEDVLKDDGYGIKLIVEVVKRFPSDEVISKTGLPVLLGMMKFTILHREILSDPSLGLIQLVMTVANNTNRDIVGSTELHACICGLICAGSQSNTLITGSTLIAVTPGAAQYGEQGAVEYITRSLSVRSPASDDVHSDLARLNGFLSALHVLSCERSNHKRIIRAGGIEMALKFLNRCHTGFSLPLSPYMGDGTIASDIPGYCVGILKNLCEGVGDTESESEREEAVTTMNRILEYKCQSLGTKTEKDYAYIGERSKVQKNGLEVVVTGVIAEDSLEDYVTQYNGLHLLYRLCLHRPQIVTQLKQLGLLSTVFIVKLNHRPIPILGPLIDLLIADPHTPSIHHTTYTNLSPSIAQENKMTTDSPSTSQSGSLSTSQTPSCFTTETSLEFHLVELQDLLGPNKDGRDVGKSLLEFSTLYAEGNNFLMSSQPHLVNPVIWQVTSHALIHKLKTMISANSGQKQKEHKSEDEKEKMRGEEKEKEKAMGKQKQEEKEREKEKEKEDSILCGLMGVYGVLVESPVSRNYLLENQVAAQLVSRICDKSVVTSHDIHTTGVVHVLDSALRCYPYDSNLQLSVCTALTKLANRFTAFSVYSPLVYPELIKDMLLPLYLYPHNKSLHLTIFDMITNCMARESVDAKISKLLDSMKISKVLLESMKRYTEDIIMVSVCHNLLVYMFEHTATRNTPLSEGGSRYLPSDIDSGTYVDTINQVSNYWGGSTFQRHAAASLLRLHVLVGKLEAMNNVNGDTNTNTSWVMDPHSWVMDPDTNANTNVNVDREANPDVLVSRIQNMMKNINQHTN